jgi:hypothetical protein
LNEVHKRNLQLPSEWMDVLGEQLLGEVGPQQRVQQRVPDHMMELERKKKSIVENHVQVKPDLERVAPGRERVYEEAQVPEK